jgi:type VI secretion system ImpH/TssG family protein
MNFYVLMEALYRRYGEPAQEPSLRTEPAQEVALFKSDPSIAFPGSELTSLIRNDAGQFTLTTKFLGFSGSQSPLPGYYLDRMARESAQNEEGLAAFLDLFSHRWTQFAYHAWRKYRYYICFRNGGTDGFSQRMYALVGLGNKSVRDKLAINHSKMLAYAGILATPGRSPDVVCNLVSHCFDLPDVTSLITGSCVKCRSICHSRTGWACVIRRRKPPDMFPDAQLSASILPSVPECRIAAVNSCCGSATCPCHGISHFYLTATTMTR